MKIRLLGTGGADGLPAFYSDTRVNSLARERGGKDIRTRAAALVDDSLKIDFGPDTLAQIQRDRLDPREWSAIVFTHSHSDHLARQELQYCLHPFNDLEYAPWTIYGNEVVCSKIEEAYPDWPFEMVRTRSFCSFTHGDFKITPVYANHLRDEDSQNLLIERDGRTLLYGTDTGIWFEETWEFLKDFRIDGLVLECTDGAKEPLWWGHMGYREVIQVADRLRKQGSLRDEAWVVTTHHSHLGDATHEELEALLNPAGVLVGFDGLELEV